MNVQEAFSPENTSHLLTPEDQNRHRINMVQLFWTQKFPDLTEQEVADRAQWFREVFLQSKESEEILGQFKTNSETVLDRLEEEYLASVTKH